MGSQPAQPLAGFLADDERPGFVQVGLLAAQADFSGDWAPLFHEDLPDRIPGPELGDYTGVPINESARLRADSYDADRLSVVSKYECRPHGSDYSMRGLANLRIDNILDPVTQRVGALHTRMGFQEMERTIWLDGCARPSEFAPGVDGHAYVLRDLSCRHCSTIAAQLGHQPSPGPITRTPPRR